MTYQQHAALHALGDPTRFAIYERLAKRPMAVGDLTRHFTITRPAVSQHLKVLKANGLVFDRKDGTRRIYQLDPAGVERLRAHFESLWDHALAAFKAAAEDQSPENRG